MLKMLNYSNYAENIFFFFLTSDSHYPINLILFYEELIEILWAIEAMM